MWKFCGKEQFPHSFGWIARNYEETVPSHKISVPENSTKLWYFLQWFSLNQCFRCCWRTRWRSRGERCGKRNRSFSRWEILFETCSLQTFVKRKSFLQVKIFSSIKKLIIKDQFKMFKFVKDIVTSQKRHLHEKQLNSKIPPTWLNIISRSCLQRPEKWYIHYCFHICPIYYKNILPSPKFNVKLRYDFR